MSDFNIFSPIPLQDQNINDCTTERDNGVKTNVTNADHPIHSSNGLIENINNSIGWANTKEQPRKGQISDDTLSALKMSEVQTRVPAELTAFIADWNQDITTASQDFNGLALMSIQHANNLRSVFQKDPTYGQMLAAHVLGSASDVKNRWDLAVKKPNEIAQPSGNVKKADVVFKKLRNNKAVPRTNKEVADFFEKRMVNGKALFKTFLGNNSNIADHLAESGNPLAAAFSSAMQSFEQVADAIRAPSGAGLESLVGNILRTVNQVGGVSAIPGIDPHIATLQNVMQTIQAVGGGNAVADLQGLAQQVNQIVPNIQGLLNNVGGTIGGIGSQLQTLTGALGNMSLSLGGISIELGSGEDGESFTLTAKFDSEDPDRKPVSQGK
jgi:hypothetical protein